jgi:hypothetical protein
MPEKMPSARRFPPPWTIEEANDACFIVRDANGQALAYAAGKTPPPPPVPQRLARSDQEPPPALFADFERSQ